MLGKGWAQDLWVKCYEAGVEQLGNHTSYRRNPFSAGPVDMDRHCVIQSTTFGTKGVYFTLYTYIQYHINK